MRLPSSTLPRQTKLPPTDSCWLPPSLLPPLPSLRVSLRPRPSSKLLPSSLFQLSCGFLPLLWSSSPNIPTPAHLSAGSGHCKIAAPEPASFSLSCGKGNVGKNPADSLFPFHIYFNKCPFHISYLSEKYFKLLCNNFCFLNKFKLHFCAITSHSYW